MAGWVSPCSPHKPCGLSEAKDLGRALMCGWVSPCTLHRPGGFSEAEGLGSRHGRGWGGARKISERARGRLCIPSTQWHQDRVSERWGAVRPKRKDHGRGMGEDGLTFQSNSGNTTGILWRDWVRALCGKLTRNVWQVCQIP